MPHQLVLMVAIGLLLASNLASLVGLERAGLDPALRGRRRALTAVAYVSAFGAALCLGALPAVA